MATAIWFLLPVDQASKPQKSNVANYQSKKVSDRNPQIPDVIQQMTILPASKRIEPKTLKSDFTQMRVQQTETKSEGIDFFDIPFSLGDEEKQEAKLKSQMILGKEMYLHDLKILDYRAYRSKPALRLNEPVMTGTPADNDQTFAEKEATAQTIDIPYMQYLEKTIQLFSNNNIKLALARFEVILQTYPDDLNANFYAGLCYFNLQSYQKATMSLQNCLDAYFQNFDEEAEWYLAKSYFADKQFKLASDWLKRISERGGFYAKQAEKMLTEVQRTQ
jgi:tetratricopeptide (TPR) repeat protein